MEVTYERKHNESFMVVLGELDTKSYEYKMIRDNVLAAVKRKESRQGAW